MPELKDLQLWMNATQRYIIEDANENQKPNPYQGVNLMKAAIQMQNLVTLITQVEPIPPTPQEAANSRGSGQSLHGN